MLYVKISRCRSSGEVYTLQRPLQFEGLSVPAGFRSDGASVPRFFWRVVFPPGDALALRAAILHDYVYRTHPEGWSRADADRLFLAVMILDGVPVRRALMAWAGVRIGGGKAWEEGGGHVQK